MCICMYCAFMYVCTRITSPNVVWESCNVLWLNLSGCPIGMELCVHSSSLKYVGHSCGHVYVLGDKGSFMLDVV